MSCFRDIGVNLWYGMTLRGWLSEEKRIEANSSSKLHNCSLTLSIYRSTKSDFTEENWPFFAPYCQQTSAARLSAEERKRDPILPVRSAEAVPGSLVQSHTNRYYTEWCQQSSRQAAQCTRLIPTMPPPICLSHFHTSWLWIFLLLFCFERASFVH